MPDVIERHQLSLQGRVPARDREYTAIDFETTGMSPGHVVEIGGYGSAVTARCLTSCPPW